MKKPFENNEIEILRRLRKGDEVAFEIIFHRYKNRVKGFVHKLLPPNISSDVILQEVFIKIWINRKNIDPAKNFSSFVFTISKNLVLDQLKSTVNKKLIYAERHILEEIIAGNEPQKTSEEDMEIMLQNCINKLPTRRRQIFNLSRFEGLTYKQIAAKLNISENTVDTQIRKSLQFLRQEFSSLL